QQTIPGLRVRHAVLADIETQEVKSVVEVHDARLFFREDQTAFLEPGRQLASGFFDLLPRLTEDDESSSLGEFHPQALAEPDVELSPHPALMTQSPVGFRSARGPTDRARDAPPDPANGLRW